MGQSITPIVENCLQDLQLADPDEARGCSTNTFVTNSLIDLLSHPLVKIYLWRHHAQAVRNSASSHKTNYIDILSESLNHEGHLNLCSGSNVTAILLNGWIWATGGVVSVRVCPAACAAGLLFDKGIQMCKRQAQDDSLKWPIVSPPLHCSALWATFMDCPKIRY